MVYLLSHVMHCHSVNLHASKLFHFLVYETAEGTTQTTPIVKAFGYKEKFEI